MTGTVADLRAFLREAADAGEVQTVTGAHWELEIGALSRQRSALPFFFAERKCGLLTGRIAELETALAKNRAEQASLEATLRQLRDREKHLGIELAGHGGNRLVEIERQLEDDSATCDQRQTKAELFAKMLADAGLDQAETAEQFAARRREITAAREAAKDLLTNSTYKHMLEKDKAKKKLPQALRDQLLRGQDGDITGA